MFFVQLSNILSFLMYRLIGNCCVLCWQLLWSLESIFVEASHAVIRTQLSWKPQIPPGAFASFFFLKKEQAFHLGKDSRGLVLLMIKYSQDSFQKKI